LGVVDTFRVIEIGRQNYLQAMQLDFLAQPLLKADAVAEPTMSIRGMSSGSIEGRPMSL
jgi:hypothetical protein